MHIICTQCLASAWSTFVDYSVSQATIFQHDYFNLDCTKSHKQHSLESDKKYSHRQQATELLSIKIRSYYCCLKSRGELQIRPPTACMIHISPNAATALLEVATGLWHSLQNWPLALGTWLLPVGETFRIVTAPSLSNCLRTFRKCILQNQIGKP